MHARMTSTWYKLATAMHALGAACPCCALRARPVERGHHSAGLQRDGSTHAGQQLPQEFLCGATDPKPVGGCGCCLLPQHSPHKTLLPRATMAIPATCACKAAAKGMQRSHQAACVLYKQVC